MLLQAEPDREFMSGLLRKMQRLHRQISPLLSEDPRKYYRLQLIRLLWLRRQIFSRFPELEATDTMLQAA